MEKIDFPIRFRKSMFLCVLLAILVPGGPVWNTRNIIYYDDYFQVAILEGLKTNLPATRYDMYRLWEPSRIQALMESGELPWWTHPRLKIAFWRPLSSALMVLDHKLAGRNYAFYHLHGLLWYVALMFAAGLALRRLVPQNVFFLSLLLYTIFPHINIGWWSARNAFIAAAIGFLALWVHVKRRETGWKAGILLSPLLLGSALMGGEAAFGVLAYFLGYEIFMRSDSWRQRVLALVPAAVVSLAWLIMSRHLGYGVMGSGNYFDPIAEPLRYLTAVPGRMLGSLGCLFLGVPAELWTFKPAMIPGIMASGLLALFIVGGLLMLAWSKLGGDERRLVKWAAFGTVTGMLPQLAGNLGTRSLMIAALGAMVIVAVLFRCWWQEIRGTPGIVARAVAAGCIILGLVRFVLAAPTWWVPGMGFNESERLRVEGQRGSGLDAIPGLAEKRVVIANVPDSGTGFYSYYERLVSGGVMPRSWRVLSYAACDQELYRTGPRQLEQELIGGRMGQTLWESLVRSPDARLKPGDQVHLSGMTVTILEADKIAPTRFRYDFDQPLEDPSLIFMAWQEGKFRRFPIPPLGASIQLKWSPIGL